MLQPTSEIFPAPHVQVLQREWTLSVPFHWNNDLAQRYFDDGYLDVHPEQFVTTMQSRERFAQSVAQWEQALMLRAWFSVPSHSAATNMSFGVDATWRPDAALNAPVLRVWQVGPEIRQAAWNQRWYRPRPKSESSAAYLRVECTSL